MGAHFLAPLGLTIALLPGARRRAAYCKAGVEQISKWYAATVIKLRDRAGNVRLAEEGELWPFGAGN